MHIRGAINVDQLNLNHPYQCKKCPQRFDKIHGTTVHYLDFHQHDLPNENEEIEEQRGLEIDEINEKVGGFDLIKIEEADINFDKRQLETDHSVNLVCVPNNVVFLD